jgi:hypothetical protein
MSQKLHCDLCDGLVEKDAAFRGGGMVTELNYKTNETDSFDLCREHLNSYEQMLKTWLTQQQGGYIDPARDWPSEKVGARA